MWKKIFALIFYYFLLSLLGIFLERFYENLRIMEFKSGAGMSFFFLFLYLLFLILLILFIGIKKFQKNNLWIFLSLYIITTGLIYKITLDTWLMEFFNDLSKQLIKIFG